MFELNEKNTQLIDKWTRVCRDIETGVRWLEENTTDQDDDPASLRTMNIVTSSQVAALTAVLIRKGIIMDSELLEAMIVTVSDELEALESKAGILTGTDVAFRHKPFVPSMELNGDSDVSSS